MKNLVLFVIPFLVASVFVGCQKENSNPTTFKKALTDDVANSLVDKYNVGKGDATVGTGKAFNLRGSLTAKTTLTQKDDLSQKRTLQIIFKTIVDEQEERIVLDVGLDESIKFPASVENARVIFIGSQLIVQDYDSELELNFFVQPTQRIQNNTPYLKTVDASMIRTMTFSSYSRGRGCICSCGECANPQACPAFQCSCSSSCGNSCSVTCRDNHHADCRDNCRGTGQR